MRYLSPLLLIAFLLDFVQFALAMAFIALQFITPIGGGAAGAAAGAALCYQNAPGIWAALWAAGQCALVGALGGGVLSSFAIPIGAGVDMVLSLTVGGGIIMLLAYQKMFYPQIIIKGFLGEAIPFGGFLPFWTWMVWQCLTEKQKRNPAKRGAMALQAAAFMTSDGGSGGSLLKQGARALARRRFASAQAQQGGDGPQPPEQKSARAPLLPTRFNDIRTASRGAALALLLLVGAHAHAQAVPDPVQYVVTPETPGAYQTVLIEVQGVGSFLGSADITWTQDGKTVKEGVGERTYTFTAGALGQKTTIRVAIDSSQGFFTQTFTFNPASINLLWEADTSVPPFYKGKALYSPGSDYRVVAFPTVYSGSARVTANALNYQWFYRGEAVPEASGLGRYTFSRTGDQLQANEDVAVEVYYGAAKVGRGELSVPATDPFIQLYPRDALRGALYDSALPAAISLTGREITVQAEGYYFSNTTKKSGLIPFSWTLNDNPASGPDSARGILTLRQSGAGTGSAALGVSMQNNNPDQFVQTATASLRLEFGATQTNSLFNFLGL